MHLEIVHKRTVPFVIALLFLVNCNRPPTTAPSGLLHHKTVLREIIFTSPVKWCAQPTTTIALQEKKVTEG